MDRISDIEIGRPVRIQLQVVAVDDLLPSIGFRCILEANLFHGTVLHTIDKLWIECARMDLFVRQLKVVGAGGSDEEARLSDMSDEFNLIVSTIGGNARFQLEPVMDLVHSDELS